MMKKIRRETEIKNHNLQVRYMCIRVILTNKSATCVSGLFQSTSKLHVYQGGSRSDNTRLRGFRQSETQTSLLSQLQNFACGKSRYDTFQ